MGDTIARFYLTTRRVPSMKIDDITRCAFMTPDPELMKVDFNQLATNAAKMRAERDAANPLKPEGPAKELARLRHELFNLEQRAKHTEIYTNEQGSKVRLIESNLAHALGQKKIAEVQGNLLAARNAEHTAARIEYERDDVVREFERARRVSAGAAIVLKEWPHRNRIEELSKQV
jgi:hypothetical protein